MKTKTFRSFHTTAATHASGTSPEPNCIMNHWTSENVLFAVTELVHGSSVRSFHNVHCSLWYVRGHKCLASLPWQPKAASHTIRPLTVFFPLLLLWMFAWGLFFFSLISQRGVVSLRNSRLVVTANKKKVTFWNTNPRKMLPNIDSHTKFSCTAQLKAPKWYGHKNFTGALLLFLGKP